MLALATLVAASLLCQPPQDVPDGLSYRLVQLSTQATVSYKEDSSADPSVSRSLELMVALTNDRKSEVFAVGSFTFSELRDGYGTDLLNGAHLSPRVDPGRQDLRARLWGTARLDGPHTLTVSAVAIQIPRVPERIKSLAANADLLRAKKVSKVRFTPEQSGEFMTLMPGVRFLLTVDKRPNSHIRCGVEGRIQRTAGRDEALEPIILGVTALDNDGRIVASLDGMHEIETRDEFLFVIKDWNLPASMFARVKEFQVVAVGDIEKVAATIRLSDLPLASPE